jgi:predicted Rossmann fold flavoprotein
MHERLKIIVMGGGAAGFFAAINCCENNPDAEVILLEKSSKLLSKVRVSGGGRCNVTHACFDNSVLVKQYPRGEKELRNIFSRFSTKDTIEWFEKRGVALHTEEDGRMFPVSNNSETIISCLLAEAARLNIRVITTAEVTSINAGKCFNLQLSGGGEFQCDRLIIATGGHPKEQGYSFLKALGHQLIKPVPSLFTFNLPENPITRLMGLSVPAVKVRISGTKIEAEGPLLITHWGLSGPAILRASAWGARVLHDHDYKFTAIISWLPRLNEEKVRILLTEAKEEHPAKTMNNFCPFELPKRLWDHFLVKAGIPEGQRWADASRKNFNVLAACLVHDEYLVNGKTTFKEEFVTCGGVSLKEINLATMESRIVPGLFFAGEVIDVDGVTGGFNFQNAWSTGFLAAKAASAVNN